MSARVTGSAYDFNRGMRDAGVQGSDFHPAASREFGQVSVCDRFALLRSGLDRRQIGRDKFHLVSLDEGLQRLAGYGHAEVVGLGIGADAGETPTRLADK